MEGRRVANADLVPRGVNKTVALIEMVPLRRLIVNVRDDAVKVWAKRIMRLDVSKTTSL